MVDGRGAGGFRPRHGEAGRHRGEGGAWSKAEEEEFKRPIRDQYERQGHPYYSTARLWDDGVIAPEETRRTLALAISASLNAPIEENPVRRFSNVRKSRCPSTAQRQNGKGTECVRVGTYSRAHRIEFEPTVRLDGNAAKENIPLRRTACEGADPEQLFRRLAFGLPHALVRGLASTMKLIVDRYVDNARRCARKEFRRPHGDDASHPAARGRIAAPPSPAVSPTAPQGPRECFIANSVRPRLIVEPR